MDVMARHQSTVMLRRDGYIKIELTGLQEKSTHSVTPLSFTAFHF